MGAAVTFAADRLPSNGLAVSEEPAGYVIALDAVGFEPDELRLEAEGRELTLLGEHRGGRRPGSAAHRRLEESLRIPDDADAERIRAVFKEGALEIHVRRTHGRRRVVPIERDYLGSSTPKGC